MDYKEFASKIKQKYPDYGDMNDLELAEKIVAKYPNEYSDVKFPKQEPKSGFGRVGTQTFPEKVTGFVEKEVEKAKTTDYGKVVTSAVKGVGKGYSNLLHRGIEAAYETSPLGITEKALELTTGYKPQFKKLVEKGAPIKPFGIETGKEQAAKAYQLTPDEVRAMDESGITGKVLAGAIDAIGKMPLYMVASQMAAGAGVSALNNPLVKALAPKIGVTQAIKLLPFLPKFIERSISMGTAFGGLGVAEGIAQNKPFGEIIKDVGNAFFTAPFYVAGGAAGGKIGGAGKVLGSGAGFASSAAVTGGSTEDIMSSFFVGAGFGASELAGSKLFGKKATAPTTIKDVKKRAQYTVDELRGMSDKQLKETIDAQLKLVKKPSEAQLLKTAYDLLVAERHIAMTDPLTGLRSPRGFEMELKQKKIQGTKMYVDVDRLKQINEPSKDVYNHERGNVGIKRIASVLMAVEKKYPGTITSRATRGDEFVLDVPPGKAREIAEFISKEVSGTKVKYSGDGGDISMSVSIGYGKDIATADANVGIVKNKLGRGKIYGTEVITEQATPGIEQPPKPTKLGAGLSPEAMVLEPTGGIPTSPKYESLLSAYDKVKFGTRKEVKTTFKKGIEEINRQLVDQFAAIEKWTIKADKSTKMLKGLRWGKTGNLVYPGLQKMHPSKNPYTLLQRFLGTKKIADQKLEYGTSKITEDGSLVWTGEGLKQTLKPVAKNIADLKRLMIAQRDIELSQRVTKKGYSEIKGTTNVLSNQVINTLKLKYGEEGFNKLNSAAMQARDWAVRANIDPLLEVGALSKQQYDAILKSNKQYIPFDRVIDELETYGYIRRGVNLSALEPMPKPIERIKGSTKHKIADPIESLIEKTYKIANFVEKQRTMNAVVNLRKLSPEMASFIKPSSSKSLSPNKVKVYENGEMKYYEVPPDLAKAVTQMNSMDMGVLWHLLGTPAKTLRAGATLTPEFLGRNYFRDQLTAFVNAKYGYTPAVDWIKGICHVLGKSNTYHEYLASGGALANLVSMDRSMTPQKVKHLLGYKNIGKYVKNPLEALQAISEAVELGTRVGYYSTMRKKGVTAIEAGHESAKVTVNFRDKGAVGKHVNMISAFWNANVQGLKTMARAHTERPVQTTVKAMIGITLPSIGLWFYNKDDERIQRLPQWQKDLFWNINLARITGNEKSPIIKIPKPFEYGLLYGSLPERILDATLKDDPDAIKNFASTFLGSAAPVPMPTAILPIVESKTNYSFFMNKPIIPRSLENVEPQYQTKDYTPESIQMLGKTTKQSPLILENYIYGWSGGLGRNVAWGLDKLLANKGFTPKKEKVSYDAKIMGIPVTEFPGVKGFASREPIGSSSDPVNKLYDVMHKLSVTQNTYRALEDAGDEPEMKKYQQKHREMVLYPIVREYWYGSGAKKTASDGTMSITGLMATRREVIASDMPMIEKERMIRDIDLLMTTTAEKILQKLRQATVKD